MWPIALTSCGQCTSLILFIIHNILWTAFCHVTLFVSYLRKLIILRMDKCKISIFFSPKYYNYNNIAIAKWTNSYFPTAMVCKESTFPSWVIKNNLPRCSIGNLPLFQYNKWLTCFDFQKILVTIFRRY